MVVARKSYKNQKNPKSKNIPCQYPAITAMPHNKLSFSEASRLSREVANSKPMNCQTRRTSKTNTIRPLLRAVASQPALLGFLMFSKIWWTSLIKQPERLQIQFRKNKHTTLLTRTSFFPDISSGVLDILQGFGSQIQTNKSSLWIWQQLHIHAQSLVPYPSMLNLEGAQIVAAWGLCFF